jgi:hypothetical protein
MDRGPPSGPAPEDEPAHFVDRVGRENAYFGPSQSGVKPPHDSSRAKDAPHARGVRASQTTELPRLNLRISSITGRTFHTPEDFELLKGDVPARRGYDMEVVRRWVANPDGHEARVETTDGSRAKSTRTGVAAREAHRVP